VRLLPKRYRLPALVLDASGMRIGELEGLTWADVDEPRQRFRVSAATTKTGRARWVFCPDVLEWRAFLASLEAHITAPDRDCADYPAIYVQPGPPPVASVLRQRSEP